MNLTDIEVRSDHVDKVIDCWGVKNKEEAVLTPLLLDVVVLIVS